MISLLDVYDAEGAPKDGAVTLLYRLLSERPGDANISHGVLPSIHEHRAFVKKLPYRAWYMVLDANKVQVGAVYATRHNELGVAILKEHQRHGYAKAALTEIMRRLKPLPEMPGERRGRWLANVSPQNKPSQALFGSVLKGRVIQLTYEL